MDAGICPHERAAPLGNNRGGAHEIPGIARTRSVKEGAKSRSGAQEDVQEYLPGVFADEDSPLSTLDPE